MDRKYGIIDLGSNSARLVIYEVKKDGSYRLIDDISETVRLSEGMSDNNMLSDKSIQKTLKTLKLFKSLCTSYKIPPKNIIAIATEAVRKAANRDYLLSEAYQLTNIAFRVLSGEEEALYIYKAVVNSLDVSEGFIMDIGGGSTEVIYFKDRRCQHYVSLPIGAVVATEQYLQSEVVSKAQLDALALHINQLFESNSWIKPKPQCHFIALGGSIRTLAKIHMLEQRYPLPMLHNYQMELSDLDPLYERLLTMNLKEREKVKGLSKNRADIIVGGFSIFQALAKRIQAKAVTISGAGLREGIFLENLQDGTLPVTAHEVLNASLDNYLHFYGVTVDHSYHVLSLSLLMFDQLHSLHQMGIEARKLLAVSSLMHDVGIHLGFYGHQHHTFYMVLNSRLNGLTHREIVLVAAIAASHSSDSFSEAQLKPYQKLLQKGDLNMYKKMALILRLSESLDRSESKLVKSLECTIDKKCVQLKLIHTEDIELEKNMASELAPEFKNIFGVDLLIL